MNCMNMLVLKKKCILGFIIINTLKNMQWIECLDKGSDWHTSSKFHTSISGYLTFCEIWIYKINYFILKMSSYEDLRCVSIM